MVAKLNRRMVALLQPALLRRWGIYREVRLAERLGSRLLEAPVVFVNSSQHVGSLAAQLHTPEHAARRHRPMTSAPLAKRRSSRAHGRTQDKLSNSITEATRQLDDFSFSLEMQ